MNITHALLFSLCLSLSLPVTAQDYFGVPYGPEIRQFVDIYLAPSECPTPVYFDAHGNGGSTHMPSSIIDALKADGVSIVAWESLTSVNSPEQVGTGWDDAERMFAWVKAHADTYNFDTTNFIIGGSSRGSILSWKYGHRPNPNIKGLYMYNALPDGVWVDSTWWYPPQEVTASSPPIFFVYKQAPGVTNDSHDPENGMIILDTYESLGIGDRDTLIHSIGSSGNSDKYQFLVDFIRAVATPCQFISSSNPVETSPTLVPYPNPLQAQLHISGLRGDEHFVLRTSTGALIQEADQLEWISAGTLSPGIYLLTIQSKSGSNVHKLIKQ